MEKVTRRSLITGLISFSVAAPAIVRAASLMPVKVMVDYPMAQIWGYSIIKDGWDVFGKDAFGREVVQFIPAIEWVENQLKENKCQKKQGYGLGIGLEQ